MKALIIELSGIRLDKYLSSHFKDLSRTKLQNLIKSGRVLCNSLPFKNPSHLVTIGEKFNIDFNDLQHAESLPPFDFKLNIIYEDEYLAVIDKPSGIVTHPGYGTKNDTLANALASHYSSNLSALTTIRPGIVHRLDKETSGLMVIAKQNIVHKLLSGMIENKTLTRQYIGLVWGIIGDEGTIETRLAKHRNNKMMTTSNYKGKIAITKYKTLDVIESKYGVASLVKFKLVTGRTHQIRVHCLYRRCPIIADKVYNMKADLNLISRHALHSYKMCFVHPVTNMTMQLESKLPSDISALIDVLHS